MKNTKLISIIAVIISVVLLACGCVLGFDRAADIGGTYLISADFLESFEHKDIEAIMKEAGATGVIVQAQQIQVVSGYRHGTSVEIMFEVEGDAEDQKKVEAVYNKALELLKNKYHVASCEYSTLSSTFNKKAAIRMWPAAIIFVILLVYVFIRFGIKNGLVAIMNAFVPTAATAGIVALTGLKVTGFTIPALLMVAALALAFAIVYMLINKAYKIKDEDVSKFAASVITKLALVVSAIAVIAMVALFIMGTSLLQSFALTALIGVALTAVTTIFVMPGAAK